MKKNGLFKKCLTVGIAALMTVGFTACGGGGKDDGKTARLDFLYTGPNDVMAVYKELIDIYNNGQGKEDKLQVKGMPVAGSGIDSKLNSVLPVSSGPDVIINSDDYFKKHTTYLQDLTGKVSGSIMNDLYESQESRYHYNAQTTTSNANDPLYGLPVYNDATVLYYNRTALKEAGVICISVDEKDLAAFNAGTLADANGKKKSDYGITINVPAKGFYRSINNYVHTESDMGGNAWKAPSSSEIMIFNDRIALSWDEIEDVGLLCTKSRNSKSATDYGYYTEWWFNYAWSVGGDCIEDMSGNGDWTYSHPDNTPNYIVKDGATFTGSYTGTVYKAGETLDIKDIIANKGDTISYYTDSSSFYYTVNGTKAEVLSSVSSSDALNELPSTQAAFKRFCYLAGVGGLNVCPYPSAFNSTSSVAYFTSKKLAFLIEKVSNFDQIKKDASFEWGVAQMPVYKEYEEPMNPECDTVKAEGKIASHSLGYSISVRKGTPIEEKAIKFVEWIMTEGQAYFAQNGHVSARKSDAAVMSEKMAQKLDCNNVDAILQSLEKSQAGDWWYMSNKSWIDIWANPLNSSVRYGKMSFDTFIYSYVTQTNESLAAFKK